MNCVSAPRAETRRTARPTRRGSILALAAACLLLGSWPSLAYADSVAAARSAYARGDFVRAVRVLTPLALRGDPRAQAMLGFMYENGFGTPQAYVVASDLYCQAAAAGNPFGQAMLGLMYDKGHGVPQDVVLAYKWLNLAAANTGHAQRSYYLRLRNAVASKMSASQIAQGQALALAWIPGQF
ncbi:tetratricopeptide repeat protein [Bradyrhizobium sp. HKCCYLRH3099]|uniref:tetratricopeptide repeat protein n=1 Tax=unclassified Bradyrhizobium TaxID=2631580 RepID=UPI003EBC5ACE